MPLNRTDNYRMKAIACELQAGDASDPTSKQGWEELAMEWHTMARTAQMEHRGVEFTVTPVEPGLWKWRFQTGEAVKTGKTKSKLLGLAARRVQYVIDRELSKSRKLASI
jgi:hypothetical protein